MRVLAFAASNSRHSINRQLVAHAAELLRTELLEDVEIDHLDINDFEMPIYSIDREQSDGVPALAQEFRERILAADRILISFAEHNGHYCAAYKNLFDWVSRLEGRVYQGRAMVLLATSPGKGGARSVLNAAVEGAPHFGCDLRGSMSVPNFHANFDVDAGALRTPEMSAALRDVLSELK